MTSHHKQKAVEKAIPQQDIEAIYPISRLLLDTETWDQIVTDKGPEQIPDLLEQHAGKTNVPEFLPALARLEKVLHQVEMAKESIPSSVDRLMLNPTIQLLKPLWRNLPSLIHAQGDTAVAQPERGEEVILAWLDP